MTKNQQVPYQTYTNLPSSLPDRPYIPYYVWPATNRKPRAIIHIVHGMSEHATRYQDLANWFSRQGFVVVGHDHIGHGPLAKANQRLGYFGSRQASRDLVEDLRRVVQANQDRFPGLAYIILGHSMGSYITRLFLDQYSNQVDASILTGTNATSLLYFLGGQVADLLNLYQPQAVNYAIHRQLFGGGLVKTKDGVMTDNPLWYPPAPGQTHDFPLAAFPFTNNGFAELVKLASRATRPSWAKRLDPQLKLLIIGGLKDPLVNGGRDLDRLANQVQASPVQSARLLVYPNKGHEVLQYSGAQAVYQDILNWLNTWLDQ
ncbi:hypothetical protein AWM75_07425 [Aerococcus urinaehominis]|uniref:Uncharacterized protein n=1 Tax=Aerococcus urinaehominis TaxID=128944 RepID=A0A120IB16_9LACT|nr:alpha/beta hydrolase [Aerococcus urinaehominis]AMB99803.1 hypothetical protein AWM75_07425 [Aerococcus urinaehominis]SDM08467.1 Lysophospholipase, alpha-beta hydrolase superfamily [Aerococcus urinaehominis]